MPNARRIKRLEQLILETVAETLQREIRDPRMGMVTITHVRLARDLTTAQLLWSCLEEESARRRSAEAMESALPLLQRRVAGALTTRVTPVLSLRFDGSLERAQRLEEIFHHLAEERGDEEEGEEQAAVDDADDPATDDPTPAAG